jgi:hypothetical protein
LDRAAKRARLLCQAFSLDSISNPIVQKKYKARSRTHILVGGNGHRFAKEFVLDWQLT